jgi:hypothetical protein
MKYKTLSAVLDALNDGRIVKRDEVSARVLGARVYISGSGMPGCLYDYGPNYSRTKTAAIEDLLFAADSDEGAPRGMATALRRYGSFSHGYMRYEVSRDTLESVLS